MKMHKNNILVIDDNAEIRENTAEILEIAGYHTNTAENGKKGIEMIAKEKPDVIVCDIMMPELDGYELLHLLRKNPDTAYIPFIFLTAKTDRSDFRKGMEMGADDYLPKPFTQLELLNAVENRLKKADILQQHYTSSSQDVSSFIKEAKSAGFLEQIADTYSTQFFTKKNILYREGKNPRYLYHLVKGKVKAYKTYEDGKEYITNLYNEGDFIGYAALIEDTSYNDTTVIMEDSEIMMVPKEDFMKIIYSDAVTASKFIKLITHNVKENEERMLALAYGSLRKRVATALINIHRKFNPANSEDKLVDMTREDVAHYVGTATESLIRTISDFKSRGLVDVMNGKIRILDLKRLQSILY